MRTAEQTTSLDRGELFIGLVIEPEPRSQPRARSEGNETISVLVRDRAIEAERAASCLLEPAPGDQVLLALGEETSFVIAVLARKDAAASAVRLGDGVGLEVRGDALRISAGSIDLQGAKAVSCSAPELALRADRAGVIVKSVDVIGHVLESSFHRVRTLARSVEALADDVTAMMKRSIRIVSDLDQTRARTIDTRAEGTITVHGENTAVTASAVAKIDGAQVHIG
jgi:phosphatidate phosphatase APP1